MDFKFVSHGLWPEKQNILLQLMHKKEIWILTNKCGNNLKQENEGNRPWSTLADTYIHTNVVLVISRFYMLRNRQSHSHLLYSMKSVVVLFAYPKKSNISTKKGATKIIENKLYCN